MSVVGRVVLPGQVPEMESRSHRAQKASSRTLGTKGTAFVRIAALLLATTILAGAAIALTIQASRDPPHQTIVRDLITEDGVVVGNVSIGSTDQSVTVGIMTIEPWVLVETDLEVAPDGEELSILHDENGTEGFQFHQEHPEGTTTAEFTLPTTADHGEKWRVAAHATVKGKGNATITSAVGDTVYGPAYREYPVGDPEWGEPRAAVEAKNWIPIADNPILPGVIWGTYEWWWGGDTERDVAGATWISAAQDTEEWWTETWRWYTKTITVGENGTDGEITLNADNVCWIYLNHELVGVDEYLFGYPRDPLGTVPVSSFELHFEPGVNTVDLVVLNLESGIPDVLGYKIGNPNGLAYSITLPETCLKHAWGQGDPLGEDLKGMCIEYEFHGHASNEHPALPEDETLSVSASKEF